MIVATTCMTILLIYTAIQQSDFEKVQEYPSSQWCQGILHRPCWQNEAFIIINNKDVTNGTYYGVLGENITITCRALTNSNWTKFGPIATLHYSERIYEHKLAYKSTGRTEDIAEATKLLTNITNSNEGKYFCTSTSPSYVHSQISWAYVKVSRHVPLTITSEPSSAGNITVKEGQTVTLQCGATGYPPPKYRWLHDSEIVDVNGTTVSTYETNDTEHLVINNTTISDSGEYTCHVYQRLPYQNTHSNISTDAVKLTVNRLKTFGLRRVSMQLPSSSTIFSNEKAGEISGGVISFIALTVMAIYVYCRRHRTLKILYRPHEEIEVIHTDLPQDYVNWTDDSKWNIERDQINIGEIIGEGAFGKVMRATIEMPSGVQQTVAVKAVKDFSSTVDKQDFLKELKVMKMLAVHPNIVQLMGCCVDKDPVWMIIEYVPHDNLLKYLHKYREPGTASQHVNVSELLSFAYHISRGMQYISSMKLLHRDLACRNILLGENKVCKISDFGLARDVIDSHLYQKRTQGRIPLRWMALESILDSIYTTKSDVWSYGIVLWEILTLGSCPYPGLGASEIIKKLKSGYRMQKPPQCSEQLYEVMTSCWELFPEKRPTFEELVKTMTDILETEEGYETMEDFFQNTSDIDILKE